MKLQYVLMLSLVLSMTGCSGAQTKSTSINPKLLRFEKGCEPVPTYFSQLESVYKKLDKESYEKAVKGLQFILSKYKESFTEVKAATSDKEKELALNALLFYCSNMQQHLINMGFSQGKISKERDQIWANQ